MINKIFGIVYIIIIFISLIALTYYVFETVEDIYKIRYENPNIRFYYYCPDHYVSQYFNCGVGLTYENLTGKYCNGVLVCENNYDTIEGVQK